MLVICPKCSCSYLVRADQIGTLGRAVRCGACKTQWVAMPDSFDLGEELDLDTALRMSEPELTAEELASANVANSALLRKSQSRSGALSSSFKIVGIVAGIIAIGIVAMSISDVRNQVNQAISGVTNALSVDENAGLRFADLKSEFLEERGLSFLKIEGQIWSDRGEPRKMPPIEIVVLSETKQELFKWTIDPPKETITAGTPVPFKAVLNSPPAESKEVAIRFGSM